MYDVPIELLVRKKKMRLKKNNIYIVRMYEEVKNLLTNLEILEGTFSINREVSNSFIQKECCKKAYLRGAFLAGGSVNNPETSSYHLEIYSFYEEHNDTLCRLLNYFDLNAKTHERKKALFVILKRLRRLPSF